MGSYEPLTGFPRGAGAAHGQARGRTLASAILLAVLAARTPQAASAVDSGAARLHYAPNHNFDARGSWRPAAAGFTLADISNVAELRDLPPGVKGLVWVGLCGGANGEFIAQLTPYIGQQAVFGFYLMDDPDPRAGRAQCQPGSLRAESDWIHVHLSGALTFIVLMNLADAASPSYQGSYTPDNSHIDLFGIDPYPCRSELKGCSATMIERYVAAAAAAGIPRARMVPVFQAFGGGRWSDGSGGQFVLPTAEQLRALLSQWRALLPTPVFDYAYSWGSQRTDQALENSPALREVMAAYNKQR